MPGSDSASSVGRSTTGSALSRRLLNLLRPRKSRVSDEEDIPMTSTSTHSSVPITSLTQSGPSQPASTAPTSADIDTATSQPTTLLFGGLTLDMTRSDDFDPKIRKPWNLILKRLLKELEDNDPRKMTNASLEWTKASGDSLSVRTILVCFEDESQKRRAEEMCTRLAWLQNFANEYDLQIRCVVTIPPFKCALRQQLQACGSQLQDGCTLLLPNHRIESLCGLRLLVKTRGCGEVRSCTLGGIVVFQDRLCAWTTRHSLEPEATQSTLPSELDTLCTPEQKIFLDVVYPIAGSEAQSHRELDYDYALINLTKLPRHVLARLPSLNKINGQVLQGYTPRDKQVSGHVVIATAGTGTLHGQLRSMTELIFIGSAAYSVQRIVVDRIIGRGCSGAWVVKDQDVCGFIVAARSDLPWLYMVPMAEALEDLERRLGSSACIATKASVTDTILDQLPVFPVQPTPDANKFEHECMQQGASELSCMEQKINRRDHRSLPEFTEHTPSSPASSQHTHSRYDAVLRHASRIYSLVGKGFKRRPSRGPKNRSRPKMVQTSSNSWSYLNYSLSDTMVGDELCVKMVPCYFEFTHDKTTQIHEEQVKFRWLLSQKAGHEIYCMAVAHAARWLAPEVLNREVYFSSCACALMGLNPPRVLDTRAVEDEAELSQVIQSMLLNYCGDGSSRGFFLTLKFECAIIDKFFSKQTENLSQMEQVLKQHMVTNYRDQRYLSRKALTIILSEDFVLQYLDPSQEWEEKTLQSPAGHSRSQITLASRILLASAILAGLSRTEISNLCQSQHGDYRMPLRSQDLVGLLSESQSQKFLEVQWSFMPVVLEPYASRKIDRSFCSSLLTEQHALVHDSMILPFVSDSKEPLLGQGLFGSVFKVIIHPEQHSLSSNKHRKFAIKQFYGQQKVSFEESECAARMLKALSETKHQHILTHNSSWYQAGRFYMLFDLADENLESYMRMAPPPTLTKATMTSFLGSLKGLADAIRHIHNLGPSGLGAPVLSDNNSAKYVHSRTCFHFDLKPANILVFQNHEIFPTLKISDFGSASIAHTLRRETQRMLPIKQSAYGAPESTGQARVGAAYDIWSLGCIFLEILVFAMGRKTTHEFAMERRKFPGENEPALGDEQFWYVDTDGKPQHKSAVVKVLKILKEWSANRGVFAELHKLVEKMLRIDETARPNAANTTNDLDALLHQANIDLTEDEDFYLQNTHTYRWELAVPPSEASDSSRLQPSDSSQNSYAFSNTSLSSDNDDTYALTGDGQPACSQQDHGLFNWQHELTENDIRSSSLMQTAEQRLIEGDSSVYYSVMEETEAVEPSETVENTALTQQHISGQPHENSSAIAMPHATELLQGLAVHQLRHSSLLDTNLMFTQSPSPISRTVDDLDICLSTHCHGIYHSGVDFVRTPPSRWATWPSVSVDSDTAHVRRRAGTGR